MGAVKSDIEIARKAKMKPIKDVYPKLMCQIQLMHLVLKADI